MDERGIRRMEERRRLVVDDQDEDAEEVGRQQKLIFIFNLFQLNLI